MYNIYKDYKFDVSGFSVGNYKWNVLAFNNNSEFDLGDSNRTFNIDIPHCQFNDSIPGQTNCRH